MKLEYYQSLPDYMAVKELKILFRNILSEIKNSNSNLEESLGILLELADRQWHTYEVLDEPIKSELEEWLLSIIDFDSDEIIDYLTLIMCRLGLSNLYVAIKNSLKSNLKKEVRKIIEEIVNEIDGHEGDPYYGMR